MEKSSKALKSFRALGHVSCSESFFSVCVCVFCVFSSVGIVDVAILLI